jgi:hypothetical protein
MIDEESTGRAAGFDAHEDPQLLRRFPHYETAASIDDVDSTISPDDFYARYVLVHRPCVIRGAAGGWAAIEDWTSEQIRSRIGASRLGSRSPGVRTEPLVEYGGSRAAAPVNQLTVAEFLDQVADPEVERVQMYAERLDGLDALAGDLGTFSFLDIERHPPRFYSDRAFMSRRGYTDWHVHTADETITVQLVGVKEFLLLPPDAATFKAMLPMAKRGVWKVPRREWSTGFSQLVPARVVLHPGDAVYIPMHWWHAVEAHGDDLNVTVARVFGTPLRWMSDVRVTNVRFALLCEAVNTIQSSIAARRPRRMRTLARMTALVMAGLPAALWHNRSRRQPAVVGFGVDRNHADASASVRSPDAVMAAVPAMPDDVAIERGVHR